MAPIKEEKGDEISPQQEEPAKGLPRPADYDDYWYEVDGEWYNEYDEELEEGQFYEQVPEEDGYIKADEEEEEEALADGLPQEPEGEQLPEEVEEQEEEEQVPDFDDEAVRQQQEEATLDPDLKAAQEAARAAQDKAKNLIGNIGGGLLGLAGGKAQQLASQKPMASKAKPQMKKQTALNSESKDEAEPPGTERPEEEEKKGVKFAEEPEKPREERQINKTRTMRPKEKWEWAFNKILRDLEVSGKTHVAKIF